MNEPSDHRDPLELLAADFIERFRCGERPSIDEYAQNHPDLAEQIRDLFPTVATLENLKGAGTSSSDLIRGTLQLERIGDFRIIRELGRGGMGIVYEAEQESLGRRVAVKVMPQQLLLDSIQLKRFEREARTAARLHHTSIVPVFGVGQHGGYHYIVMQYIRGIGLDVVLRKLRRMLEDRAVADTPTSGSATIDPLRIARSLALDATQRSAGTDSDSQAVTSGIGPVYWRGIARIALQAAEALEYAHRQDTLHRDIKPGNLLIDADGMVWVADFGLAKAFDQDGATQTSGIVGTLRYMAPEQLQGKADARSDIYSLGLTLYELATLHPAFVETSKTSLIEAILRGRPKTPRFLISNIPRDLETMILKSIGREPNARYTSAAELANDLRCFIEDRPIRARRATVIERLWRWSRRNPALAALTGTAAALLIAVTAVTTAAYIHTNQANIQVNKALEGEQSQRRRAEITSGLALEALDTIFAEFAPHRTISVSMENAESSDAGDLAIAIQPVLSKETATLLEHMLSFYRRLAEQEGENPAIRRKVARANQRLGDIHQRLGNFEASEKAYSRALTLYAEPAHKLAPGPDAHLEMARIHNELGNLFVARERGKEAHDEFSHALSILETVQPSSESRFELARTHFLLGRRPRLPLPRRPPRDRRPPRPPSKTDFTKRHRDVPPPRGERPPKHRPLFRKRPEDRREREENLRLAIAILTELRTAHPEVPSYRYLLARCYRELRPPRPDSIHSTPSDPRAQAAEILEELVQAFPTVPQYRFELSETYATLDKKRRSASHGPPERTQHLQAAIRIMEELATERPNAPDYTLSLARMHNKLGHALKRGRSRKEAERNFRQAIALQTSLARRFPKVGPYAVGLAVYQISLAELLSRDGKLAEARRLLESCVTALESDACRELEQHYVFDLSERSHRLLSEILRRMDEHELADNAARRADEARRSKKDRPPPQDARPSGR
ncbi:MAG: serine/threonine-protein kinase [Phycisphaerales bacterium]|nr:serine/threonine-protein kinase [Phycisphaerales bacterium]